MSTYIVLYWEVGHLPADPPISFRCHADDADHAEEQCKNAYPGCAIAWVWEGESGDDAYADYWAWR
jgi:hypothetical protein